MTDLPVVRLARGRDSSLRRRHPWVFSGAVGSVEGEPAAGDAVEVVAADGSFLARGAYSPASQIRVRAVTFDPREAVDEVLIRRRLEAAAARRAPLLTGERSAARLVHAESDGLPGVVVDRFADVAVVQLLSAFAERWRRVLVDGLAELPGVASVYERSDAEVRSKEGLEAKTGLVAGPEPGEAVEIEEDERHLLVDIRSGHKTGFYLDQRPNRSRLRRLLASGRVARDAEVLDAFCYTGGFSLAAAQGGAGRLTQIDASAPALEAARRHLERAGFAAEKLEQIEGNAFGELRRLRAEERRFDVVVLDPPKFADSKARVAKATRGYKDVNLLAFQLLRPGGYLLTFSCSGRVSAELFQKVVAGAALDADREVQIVERLGAGEDHPVSLAFPEAEYLTGLVCRVL